MGEVRGSGVVVRFDMVSLLFLPWWDGVVDPCDRGTRAVTVVKVVTGRCIRMFGRFKALGLIDNLLGRLDGRCVTALAIQDGARDGSRRW